jgi:phospholipase C
MGPALRVHHHAQAYPGASSLKPADVLLPFHLNVASGDYCTDDLTHEWGPQHLCWNNGAMDSYVKTHTSSTYEGADGAMTMGYYNRSDLPFYYALADNYTLCDSYHCSILGPTHPNRLMANSGSIDPAGLHGGPVTDTNGSPEVLWTCTWPTVQEVLEDAAIQWKAYHPSNLDLSPQYAALAAYPTWDPALYNPTVNPEVMLVSDHVVPYFKSFENPLSPLHQKAFNQTFPGQFARDIQAGNLPAVSWIIPPLGFDEHPSSSPERGMYFTSLVLEALTSNPDVWAHTVLFLMYDENDGWFDHVAPPVAKAGTADEYLTAATIATDTLGIRGPLGLGVRVPMLVVSPFSRGGHIATEMLDHTSQLRFLGERFGIEVPNVSEFRRFVSGDLTTTLFNSAPDYAVPNLPAVSLALPAASGSCDEVNQDSESGGASPSIPSPQTMPTQQGTTVLASEYGY